MKERIGRLVLAFAIAGLLSACGGAGNGDGPGDGIASNPQAQAGEQHNEILACLADGPTQGRDLVDAMERCGWETDDEFGAGELRSLQRDFGPDLPDWIRWIVSSPFNPNPTTLGGGDGISFSEAQAGLLERLGAILFFGGAEDVPSSAEIAAALDAIADLEIEAAETLAETPTDTAVWAALSIAGNSIAYWEDAFDPSDDVVASASGPKWWQVAAADVAGGIVGGVFGGGVGAVGLGTAASKIVADGAAGGGDANPGVGGSGNVGVGEAHNELLACLETEPSADRDLVGALVVCGWEADEATKDRVLEGVHELGDADRIVTTWIDDWSTQVDLLELDEAQERYLLELGRLIDALDDDSDFDRALLALRLLESRARAELVGASEGDAPTLMGLNIAVWSFQYWQDSDFVAPAAGKPRWWEITLADVGGGVVGGIFGGAAGAIGLGTAASKIVADVDAGGGD